jgi:hypothetical protein
MLRNMATMPTPQTVYILPLTLNPVFGGAPILSTQAGAGGVPPWLDLISLCVAGTSYYALVDRRTLERMQELQAKGDLFLGLFLQKDPNPNVKVSITTRLEL